MQLQEQTTNSNLTNPDYMLLVSSSIAAHRKASSAHQSLPVAAPALAPEDLVQGHLLRQVDAGGDEAGVVHGASLRRDRRAQRFAERFA